MVIRIGINYPIFTLNEKVTLTDPEFILICKNYFTKKQSACKLGLDSSSDLTRYNQFELTVTSDPNNLNSEIALDEFGFYKYFVYEIADADTFDFDNVDTLDLETMDGLVETGKILYENVPVERESYVNTTPSRKVYVS